jgi:hypothetical protein
MDGKSSESDSLSQLFAGVSASVHYLIGGEGGEWRLVPSSTTKLSKEVRMVDVLWPRSSNNNNRKNREGGRCCFDT